MKKKNSRTVAIIPARGGSKRIPRKNIRNFLGKPMISYAIATAQESGLFSEIVVSTDDAEIGEVAAKFGATVPFIRPETLADDHCGTLDVIKHCVENLKLSDDDMVCCIYPTSIFTKAADLQKSLTLFQEGEGLYCFPVSPFPARIQRGLVREGAFLRPINSENVKVRTQDLPDAFYDLGQFYWALARTWKSAAPIHSERIIGYILDGKKVVDIDTEEDWKHAEWMCKILNEIPEEK